MFSSSPLVFVARQVVLLNSDNEGYFVFATKYFSTWACSKVMSLLRSSSLRFVWMSVKVVATRVPKKPITTTTTSSSIIVKPFSFLLSFIWVRLSVVFYGNISIYKANVYYRHMPNSVKYGI